jgi:hypothetical protein
MLGYTIKTTLEIEDKTQFITLMSYVASKNNASFPSHLFGKTK